VWTLFQLEEIFNFETTPAEVKSKKYDEEQISK